MKVRISSEMLVMLSSAKTHAIDIVQKWRLDTTLFPSFLREKWQLYCTFFP